MESFVEEYDISMAKKFIKAIKNHKFECFYKLIMTYTLSRNELLNLQWDDIDFENNTITVYAISLDKESGKYKYQRKREKHEELGRTFPLLPCIRKLLIKEREKTTHSSNYVCIRPNGLIINANTLSRNVRMIAKRNKLPETLISGIKKSCHSFFLKNSPNYEFFRCWTRFDIEMRKENLYSDFDICTQKRFLNIINNFIDTGNMDLRTKTIDSEMWG